MDGEDAMENNWFQYFRLFREVCKAVNSTLNLGEVLKLITESIVPALNLKACTIFLLDPKHKTLKARASYGLSQAYLKKGVLEADKSIAESLEGKSVLIAHATEDPRVQYPEEAKREGIASIYSVAISVKGQIIGVLRLYTSQPRDFLDDEKELIAGLAEMGGIAIDNARMYDHLKSDHERLIRDVHQWFEFGRDA